jgi:hypothetical protein
MTIDAPSNQVKPGTPVNGYEAFPTVDYHLNDMPVTMLAWHLSSASNPVTIHTSCHSSSRPISIIRACRNDSPFSPILCLTPWSDAISWRRILSGAATGRWDGCSPKTCPPPRWLPSPATGPTGCARLPSTTINTPVRASATGYSRTSVALSSTWRSRIRRSRADPTVAHRMEGCRLGRRPPERWPPGSGDRCIPSEAEKCPSDSACARKCCAHGMRRRPLTLKQPLNKQSLKKAPNRSADCTECLAPVVPPMPSPTELSSTFAVL